MTRKTKHEPYASAVTKRRALHGAMARLVAAEHALAFKGGTDPENWDQIEAASKRARANMMAIAMAPYLPKGARNVDPAS